MIHGLQKQDEYYTMLRSRSRRRPGSACRDALRIGSETRYTALFTAVGAGENVEQPGLKKQQRIQTRSGVAQTGGRFSTNAATPSWAQGSIILQAIV